MRKELCAGVCMCMLVIEMVVLRSYPHKPCPFTLASLSAPIVEEKEPSRILIVGATGYIGTHVAKASVLLLHPTFALIRPSSSSSKLALLQSLGITLLNGSLQDHHSLLAALRLVDVVISCVNGPTILHQHLLISAIIEVGTIKRFLPSEFGNDVDHAQAMEPVSSMYAKKIAIRRAVEAAGIPYTYISSNSFAGYSLANLVQFGKSAPPRDKVTIYGSGDSKAIFVKEQDIGTYTIKTVDDPRTLNKTVYLRPPANVLSINEIVAIWEKKIGHSLEKEYLSDEDLRKQIETASFPMNMVLATIHNIFVKGDQYNFEIGPNGVEASELYPEVQYTTADEYLNQFL